MSWDASSDNATSLIVAAPSPALSGLTVTVTTGDGASFPAAPFWVAVHAETIWPTRVTRELVRVGSVSGDVLTFVTGSRGSLGSTARTIVVGDRISRAFTSAELQAIQAQIDANTTAITAEATARGTAVTAEATTRASADTALSTSIASEATTARAAEGANATAIATKATDSAVVHNTGTETVAGVKTFSSSPVVPTPTTSGQAATKGYADTLIGASVVSRTLAVGGSVSGATPLDLSKDQIKQFVLAGNAVISASTVAATGAQLVLLADQPASGGPFTLGISDGTTTTPVTDSGWTAGQRMIVLVVWSSVSTFTAVVLNVVAAPVAPAAPVNLTAPAVAGSTPSGSTLTVTPGTYSGSPSPTLSYVWKSDGTTIPGETATTYVTEVEDVTHVITVAETATNASGSASATSNGITVTTAAFSPASISGLKVWLKADALAGPPADGAAVATWTDSSGGAHNATQASAPSQPVFKTGIFNGKPVLRFPSTHLMSLGDLSALIPTAATLFVVYASTEDAGFCLYSSHGDGGPAIYWRYGGAGPAYMGPFRSARISGYPAAGAPADGAAHIITVRSGTDYTVFTDGVGTPYGGAHTHSPGTDHNVSSDGAGPPDFIGDIAEVLVYDTALSTGNRTSVEGYLRTKYATP
jgi:hypothetical protein